MVSKIHALAMAALLAGCAAPTPQQIAAADYGAYPDNYTQIINSFFASTLKDPSSVQFDGAIPPPQKAYLSFMGKTDYGYKTCVRYNAKNSYGGYAGFSTEYLLINNGKVVQSIDKADRVAANMGIQLC